METEIIVSPDVISVRAQVYGTVSRSIMQSSRAKSYTPLWSRFRALAIRAAPRDSHPNADFLRTSCGSSMLAAFSFHLDGVERGFDDGFPPCCDGVAPALAESPQVGGEFTGIGQRRVVADLLQME